MSQKYNFLVQGVANNSFVSRSPVMSQILKKVESIRDIDSNVLINGASSVGKSSLAKQIHISSLRAHKKVVFINCLTANSEALEAELFGLEKDYIKGHAEKIGLLELINGGTLVLDEISQLSKSTQEKILHLITEKEFVRLGGVDPISVNIRIISTNSKNLEEMVKAGEFLEQFYYRLNNIVLNMPSLKERKEDISKMAFNFINEFRAEFKHEGSVSIDEDVFQKFESYSWPGNLQELKNTCQRLVIFSKQNRISVDLLPESFDEPKNSSLLELSYNPEVNLNDLCRDYILKSLEHHKSKSKAAKSLGITIKTLYNKLHEYGDFKKYAIHSSKK